jgi:hypothetical protein
MGSESASPSVPVGTDGEDPKRDGSLRYPNDKTNPNISVDPQ